MLRELIMAGALLAGFTGTGQAAMVASADLLGAPTLQGSTLTMVKLDGASVPSGAPGGQTMVGNGFTVTFDTQAGQGLVKGMDEANHAIPVAGLLEGGQLAYLTGGYGSAHTSDRMASGAFLSTGFGAITIAFAVPQTAITLLWGSIDAGNLLTFNNAAHDALSGGQVQVLARGFGQGGDQGFAGSAYVTATTDTPFTSVVLSSSVMSFEAAAIAVASVPEAVSEPATLALLGITLVAMGMVRRRAS